MEQLWRSHTPPSLVIQQVEVMEHQRRIPSQLPKLKFVNTVNTHMRQEAFGYSICVRLELVEYRK